MNLKTLLIVILVSSSLPGFSQVDYLTLKHKYSLSCASYDSVSVVKNQLIMDSLQSIEITNGKKQYLYDHGWVYYIRFAKWNNKEDAEIAAMSFEKGWNDHQDINALWNLGLIYRLLDKCTKSLDMTELYLQEAPDSTDVDYQQIYYRYKFCRGKE
jgi:hypothetical protein